MLILLCIRLHDLLFKIFDNFLLLVPRSSCFYFKSSSEIILNFIFRLIHISCQNPDVEYVLVGPSSIRFLKYSNFVLRRRLCVPFLSGK